MTGELVHAAARYVRPASLGEALASLVAEPSAVLLAGGTDIYPARVGKPVDLRGESLIDLTAIAGWRSITRADGFIRIGAAVTWRQVLEEPLPDCFFGLKAAAREVGGPQIQNAGTLVGNVCNASPAADGVPALMALDAQVELASLAGVRMLALRDFVLGNRKTARRADELVAALLIPERSAGSRATFLKLGSRKYLVISIAMVAVTLDVDGAGRIAQARVVVGACSAVAQHLTELEAALQGIGLKEGHTLVAGHHFGALSPMDDVRGTRAYRLHAAQELVVRALQELAQ